MAHPLLLLATLVQVISRRVALPPGRYDQVRRSAVDGCLLISLRKAA